MTTTTIYTVRTTGRYQWDVLVRSQHPDDGNRSEHNITVFCDDRDDARLVAVTEVGKYGYFNCTADKIVKRGQVGTLFINKNVINRPPPVHKKKPRRKFSKRENQ